MRTGGTDQRREFPLALLGWLITGATLLPFLLLTGYGVTYWLQDQQQTERKRLSESAEALSRAIDRDLRGHFETARVLAMSSQLRSGDITAFERLARDAATGVEGHFLLADRDAQQLVNTRSQMGASLPKTADPGSVAQVFATGRRTVTDLILGAVAKEYLFAVRVPVEVEGAVRYVLAFVPRAGAILDVVKENYLPEGWFAAVVDGNGRIMARTSAHEQFYGKLASAEFREHLKNKVGLVETTDLEGRRTFTAFHTSALSNWRAVVWAPKSVITAPTERAKEWALGVVLLTVFVSAAAAWLSGRTIHAAAQRLARAAKALGDGEKIQFKPTRVKEVNVTGRALVDASRSIADREQAIRLSDERFSAAFRLAPVAMAIATISDGRQVAVNEARLKLTGHAPDEIIGKTPEEIGFYLDHEKDYPRLREGLARNGEVVAEEFELRRKNGDRYTGLISAATIPLNGIPHLLAIIVDITERKRAEEHTQMLLREVNHRSKNLLAVAQAVARQTARKSDPSRFVEAFIERIQALAASHDLVVGAEWRGVDVEALVRAQLAHFKDLIGTRVRIKGPAIKITAPAAQGIGMALHELATNAGKYGALSSDDGRVEVSWEMAENQGNPLFKIAWRESGGPTVLPPQRRGFGHTVIVDLAQAAVRGEARLDFSETGVVWELKGPVDEICESFRTRPATSGDAHRDSDSEAVQEGATIIARA